MEMKPYHKIQTVFKRDPKTKFRTLLEGDYADPAFEFLKDCEWEFTEKVDGTNIRIGLNKDGDKLHIQGRTDRSQIPMHLYSAIKKLVAPEQLSQMMTLYGEGYGAKIQKGGGNYKSDGASFVLFDVKCGDFWLERDNVLDVAKVIGIQCVPLLSKGTIPSMVKIVRDGFISRWGDFQAEGIVARPCTGLFARDGSRIITKLKCRDFRSPPQKNP